MLRLVSKRILGAASWEVPAPALQVLPRFYHERVVRSFDKNDTTVGTGLVGAPACGDVMKLQIKDEEKTGKIVDACFKTFGGGSAIASSSVGKQMEGVSSIKNIEIVKHLSSYPFKLDRLIFAKDAIKAGVKSYEARRGLATATEATSGETAATPVMVPVTNRLRPISPHLSIYKPQSSSMTSIFNRISGATLAVMVLGFYILCMKMPMICFTFAEFYQFFHFSANFSVICAQIAAVAMFYHLYDGIKRLLH